MPVSNSAFVYICIHNKLNMHTILILHMDIYIPSDTWSTGVKLMMHKKNPLHFAFSEIFNLIAEYD